MADLIQTSFAAGEVTDDVFGRVDLDWYGMGLSKCRNCYVQAHGGVSNRGGLKFISEVYDSNEESRLIEFQFSTVQAYGLEFSDEKMRVFKDKALVLEPDKTITAITKANPAEITITSHGFATGKKVYLKNIGGMTELNGRFYTVTSTGTNTFTIGVDSIGFTTYTSGGDAGLVYELITPYSAAQAKEIKFVQSADVVYITHKDFAPRELSRTDHHVWSLDTMTFSPELSAPTGLGSSASSASGTTKTYKYVITAQNDVGEESLASAVISRVCDVMGSGSFVTLTWSAVSGAVKYNIYKEENDAGVYGYIGSAISLTFKDINLLGDTTKTPVTTARNPFDGVGKYPSCVSLYEQRLIFGAPFDEPQTVYTSRTGNYYNMDVSEPARADDAVTFTLASKQVNAIEHIFDLNDLILFTRGGEWRVHGGAEGDPIIPSGINAKKQTGWGCNSVNPTLIGETILYVQKEGRKLRALGYDLEKAGYKGNDLTIRVPHFFEDGETIIDMAYAQEPHSILWCVLSTGELLGFTYVEEQNVWAWHKHTTDGLFESVMVIDEGGYSVPYFVVKRNINGQDVRYIEYMDERQFTDVEDCFFVDSGLSYNGSETSSLSGLDHLEGELVSVLADGNVQNQKTVEDGAITLDRPASVVHVGLPYLSYIQTLRPVINMGSAGQGKKKVLGEVDIRVKKTRGIKVGRDLDSLEEIKPEELVPDDELPLKTGDMEEIVFANEYHEDGRFVIAQDYPLPMNIIALMPKVVVDDDR